MTYKGFNGKITFLAREKIFHGTVVGISDVITFQGRTPQEAEKAFKESVDDYLNWCLERGKKISSLP